MATLAQRILDLGTRVATECKSIRTLVNGNNLSLAALSFGAKINLVASLNELKAAIDGVEPGGQINDASSASLTQTWSITKISDSISTALAALTTGAPTAMNTLDELAAALGDDANFAGTITTALGNRVRTDTAAQGLTAQEQLNARTNIDVYGKADIGDTDTNFVTTFNTGLV
jgi:hypothetical protein